SDIEHAAVHAAVDSLASLGFDRHFVPVDGMGQPKIDAYSALLTPQTAFTSFMAVNNVTGAILPIEDLSAMAKRAAPGCVTHTDFVQGFGKVSPPRAGGPVDLLSLSAHKIGGPKGVGALVALNAEVLNRSRFRPMIWGGGQESGWRGGTQNAGLIAGFGEAVRLTLEKQKSEVAFAQKLQTRLREGLIQRGLLDRDPAKARVQGRVLWVSPPNAVPHVVCLCIPELGPGEMATRLEAHDCLVSTGSACSSGKKGPDHVLDALGLDEDLASRGIRVSLCCGLDEKDVDGLVEALADSLKG
ncbi:MAG TPA: aminotransferase class V-fold PLP-dependent enzyme, partial [Bdellovibrionota bacterium]|nr:aminotransferase class V-fold PLP-dependent enzyme [Bdellovibrionota bacterium]